MDRIQSILKHKKDIREGLILRTKEFSLIDVCVNIIRCNVTIPIIDNERLHKELCFLTVDYLKYKLNLLLTPNLYK